MPVNNNLHHNKFSVFLINNNNKIITVWTSELGNSCEEEKDARKVGWFLLKLKSNTRREECFWRPRLPSWSRRSYKNLICAPRSLTRTQHQTACGGYVTICRDIRSPVHFLVLCCNAVRFLSYSCVEVSGIEIVKWHSPWRNVLSWSVCLHWRFMWEVHLSNAWHSHRTQTFMLTKIIKQIAFLCSPKTLFNCIRILRWRVGKDVERSSCRFRRIEENYKRISVMITDLGAGNWISDIPNAKQVY
jgi:hypothetical protein